MGVTKLMRRGMKGPIHTVQFVFHLAIILLVVLMMGLVFEVVLVLLGVDEKLATLMGLGVAVVLFFKKGYECMVMIVAPLIRKHPDRLVSVCKRAFRMFLLLFVYVPILTVPVWLSVVSVAIFWKPLMQYVNPFDYFITYEFKFFFIILGTILVTLLEFVPSDWFQNVKKFNQMNELVERHR